MSFSERLLAAWYQGHPALALLRPLEALYRRVANGRRADFLSGRKPAYRAPLPVLVVGNITVGGTCRRCSPKSSWTWSSATMACSTIAWRAIWNWC